MSRDPVVPVFVNSLLSFSLCSVSLQQTIIIISLKMYKKTILYTVWEIITKANLDFVTLLFNLSTWLVETCFKSSRRTSDGSFQTECAEFDCSTIFQTEATEKGSIDPSSPPPRPHTHTHPSTIPQQLKYTGLVRVERHYLCIKL